jgi:hypothetical protein
MSLLIKLTNKKFTSFNIIRLLVYFLLGLTFVSVCLFIALDVKAQGVVSCALPNGILSNSYVTVNSDQAQVNVRSGPNSYQYGKVGILFTYESAAAVGRSPGGDWIQISCPGAPGGVGWVYAANVTLTSSTELPIIDMPSTSTPQIILSIDPSLAADFPTIQPTQTRLPTYTPGVIGTAPALPDETPVILARNLQGGLIIIGFLIGISMFFLSFLLKR